MPHVELYASGLGLMLYSPAVVLDDGGDYMPPRGPLRPPLDQLVADHRVVFIQTGSPQADYAIDVELGPPAPAIAAAARWQTRFGIAIGGGALCIRDGYDPMAWEGAAPYVQRVALADGYHAITALRLPADEMRLYFYCTPATERIAGDGWVTLF